jgi:hypothetical protein
LIVLIGLQFWDLPESAEDVFTLFSPTDIRRSRDNALYNLETLVVNLVNKLCELRNTPSFPDAETATERQALNCVRVLTRLIPYLYEVEQLESWEEKLFWEPRKKSEQPATPASDVIFDGDNNEQTPVPNGTESDILRPLGEELIDVLVDMLTSEHHLEI